MERAPINGMSAKQFTALRRKLLAARKRLARNLSSFGDHTGPAEAGDFADQAMDCLERETAWHVSGSRSESILNIDRSLEKMAEGTYGICEACGQSIPFVRLRLLPSARLCVSCKSREEAEESTWCEVERRPGMSFSGEESDPEGSDRLANNGRRSEQIVARRGGFGSAD